MAEVPEFEADEITATQLAVNAEVEEGQFAYTALRDAQFCSAEGSSATACAPHNDQISSRTDVSAVTAAAQLLKARNARASNLKKHSVRRDTWEDH